VAKVTGFPWAPAPPLNNNLTIRLDTVTACLTRTLGEGRPGLLLSPRCKVLRKAFNSGYRCRRVQIDNTERYEDKPEKNEWSHPMDALQYALCGGGEYLDVVERRKRPAGLSRQAYAVEDRDEAPRIVHQPYAIE